uniref:BTB domain-containing protein n=1 Tax=Panagrolaimus davidi TaxID=227884 RepID=A0A914PG14_9BILA
MAINNRFLDIQLIKYNLFKSQDPEIGRFDVTFEIGEKRLYAHKNCLNLISDTFDSMLSQRWISKDEPIKLKENTFDEFFEFLTFLYSAECQLTDANIFSMIDIAEFYSVSIFKNYCEEYLSNMKFCNEDIFHILELAEKYSLIKVKITAEKYIVANFLNIGNSDGFLNLKKSDMKKIVFDVKDKVKPDDLFQVVYKWIENQVLQNQSNNSSISKNDAIKSEISEFLPVFNFGKMELKFLHRFIVPRGFIFSSLDELSNVLCGYYPENSIVTVTNANGVKLSGSIVPDKNIIETIKTLKLSNNLKQHINCSWWNTLCRIPTIPSLFKIKEDDVQWCLILYGDEKRIGLTLRKHLFSHDYLLAVMVAEDGKAFYHTPSCKIKIE